MTDNYSENKASDYLIQNAPLSNQPKHLHNDYPDYYYAGFWIRFFAFMVDLVCIKLISGIVFTLVSTVTEISSELLVVKLFNVLVYLAYFILLTKLTNGQTIGKMIFGIQVVCFNEERLSWLTVLVREGACRFVLQLGVFVVGYLVAAFTSSKQHVGDFFSDTSVVTINMLKADQGLKV